MMRNRFIKQFILACLLLMSSGVCMSALAGIILGDPNGRISLTEVFDYQCPHCRKEYWVIHKLMAKNPALKLNLYPVAILNHLSLIQASSSIAAALSTKTHLQFSMLNDAYLRMPFHSEGSIYSFLNRMGANNSVLKPLMHAQAVLSMLQAGDTILHKVGVKGVPVLILKQSNKVIAVHFGETSYKTLQEEINRVS